MAEDLNNDPFSFESMSSSTHSSQQWSKIEKDEVHEISTSSSVTSSAYSRTIEEDLFRATHDSSEAQPLIKFQEFGGGDLPTLKTETVAVKSVAPAVPITAQQPVKVSVVMETHVTSSSSDKSVASSCDVAKTSTASCSSCCNFMKNLDPRIIDLIYWRDIKKTGVVFGSTLVLLLSLALFSVLSVLAYLSLVTLTITLTYKLYRNAMNAVQKTGEGHPFKQYLDMDVSVTEDRVHQVAEIVVTRLSSVVAELRRLFFVEDVVDSLKFGLLLWVLTYIGAWFNGITLVILDVILVFTLPKVYEVYQVPIDEHVGLAKTRIMDVWKQVQEKVPFLKKKQA